MAAAAAYAGRGSAELPRVAIYRGKAEVLLPRGGALLETFIPPCACWLRAPALPSRLPLQSDKEGRWLHWLHPRPGTASIGQYESLSRVAAFAKGLETRTERGSAAPRESGCRCVRRGQGTGPRSPGSIAASCPASQLAPVSHTDKALAPSMPVDGLLPSIPVVPVEHYNKHTYT